jgi:hypothetical protein
MPLRSNRSPFMTAKPRLAFLWLAVFLTTFVSSAVTRAAEPRVVLFRGWFGVFSTGLDEIEDKLEAKGIKAEVRMHMFWDEEAERIVQERAAGKIRPIVLIGHSQGATSSINVASYLKSKNIPVDLIVTLAPFLPPTVPNNVLHVINYYQFPGWGMALDGEPGFHGKIDNINIVGDLVVTHITVDKTAKIQDQIIREIEALAQAPEPPTAAVTTKPASQLPVRSTASPRITLQRQPN